MIRLLRTNRDFRALWIAQVVSYGGDWFTTVALLGLVGDLTDDSALGAAMVFVAQTVPSFLLSPLAGAVADRVDRRVVIIVVSLVQAVAALGFLLVGPSTLWLAFACQGAIAGLAAFVQPAAQAALPNLVDPDDLGTAAATLGAVWGAMLAIGASLGAAFAALFGRDAAFIADAVSFVVAAVAVAAIRRPTRAPTAASEPRRRIRPVHDTAEALRYARSRPALLALVFSKSGLGVASGVVGLLAVLATTRFGGGDGAIGILLAARGLGVVIGPVIAARLAGRSVPALLQLCGLAALVYGVAYAGVAVAPTLALAAVGVLVAHLGGGTQWTLSTYGLQLSTPDALRGRIMAADFALVTLTMTVSYLVAGGLEALVGVTAALLGLSAVAVVWGLVYLRLTRRLRDDPKAVGDTGSLPSTDPS